MKDKTRFRAYRLLNNYKQQEIADYLNVPLTTYANYEQDKTETDYATLKKLAALYKITINQLLGEDDENLIIISKEQYKSLLNASEKLNEILNNIKPSTNSIRIKGNKNKIKIKN